jgi:DNA-binding transcriptional ArsR family regulator
MTGSDPEDAATLLRAMAHPMRLRILWRLLEGECAVSSFETELGLRQPNLSQQLAALREAGLVATRREAKSVFYRLADERVAVLLAALNDAAQPAPRKAVRAGPAPRASTAPRATHGDRRSGECGVFPVVLAANR